MTRIDHVALWTRDLDRLREFYVGLLGATAGPRHEDPRFGFASYFLSFEGGGRIELMSMPSVPETRDDPIAQATGWAHVAFALGSRAAVDALAASLAAAGHRVIDPPHVTSDGYYECAALDPDGNRIEVAS